jgi:hypothetical protein
VLTLKTNLLRAQAIGTIVYPLTQLNFASLTRDGATFTVGGQSNPMYVGTRRLAIGTQAESAEATDRPQAPGDHPGGRAYLLGIPQSAVANNRLLVTENLNTATLLGMYAAGRPEGWHGQHPQPLGHPVQDLATSAPRC